VAKLVFATHGFRASMCLRPFLRSSNLRIPAGGLSVGIAAAYR
jgi:hypothetical protein